MSVEAVRIAAAAYPLDRFVVWSDYLGKLRAWVSTAAESGAQLLVFPEYGGLELSCLSRRNGSGELAVSVAAVAENLAASDRLHADLAQEFGVHICAGSAPVFQDGRLVNRARFYAPEGLLGYQDKLIPTPWERSEWNMSPGDGVSVFDTSLGRIGVMICYDAEFPLIARAMVEAGAEILLVPSATEHAQGFWRVRTAAQSRALEGQCVVAHAALVGAADWIEAVDVNIGAAAVLAPPDGHFPADGVVAKGVINTPGWTIGDVSLAELRRIRREGAVRNLNHWSEQDDRLREVQIIPSAETV